MEIPIKMDDLGVPLFLETSTSKRSEQRKLPSFHEISGWGKKKRILISKKSPTGPTERTPKKPEYQIDLVTYLGVRWKGPIQFLKDDRLLAINCM